MTVWASSFISGSSINAEQLDTDVESLACDVDTASSGALSVASSTFTTLSTVTISVSADEAIYLFGNLNFSISDGTATLGTIRLYQASTALTNDYILSHASSNAGGQIDSHSIQCYAENLSGSIAFSLKFARFSGAGTVHSVNSQLWVARFKKR